MLHMLMILALLTALLLWVVTMETFIPVVIVLALFRIIRPQVQA